MVCNGWYRLVSVGMGWYALVFGVKSHTNPFQHIPTFTNLISTWYQTRDSFRLLSISYEVVVCEKMGWYRLLSVGIGIGWYWLVLVGIGLHGLVWGITTHTNPYQPIQLSPIHTNLILTHTNRVVTYYRWVWLCMNSWYRLNGFVWVDTGWYELAELLGRLKTLTMCMSWYELVFGVKSHTNPFQHIPTSTNLIPTWYQTGDLFRLLCISYEVVVCEKMGWYRLLSVGIGWYWIAWVGVGYYNPYQPIQLKPIYTNLILTHTNREVTYYRWVWFVYEFVVQVVMGLYGLTLVGMSLDEFLVRLKTHTNPYQPIPTHTNALQPIPTSYQPIPTERYLLVGMILVRSCDMGCNGLVSDGMG